MPCWYYDKKELRSTPSLQNNIDPGTEARYRREGARFILDAGAKLGLRHDTCTTGVVYFHRFYMFHSFKEFHRYVTGACCLFLAGKVEETPKKCKDIIKTCQSLLTADQFKVFGEDPKEEVMTLERVLLQTIKFDLQVHHPYGMLLKYAKLVKGDKEKIQKMVQMAWTFVNDSLCTTLCLQWEPEIIALSLMYLASRLTKYDVQDYQGKIPGSKLKWWEYLIEDMSMELMEDVCHQVLDLYSPSTQKREESPPLTPAKKSVTSQAVQQSPGPTPGSKRSHSTTPSDNHGVAQKIPKIDPSLSRPPSDVNRQLVKTEESQAPPPSQPELQKSATTVSEIPTTHNYSQYNPYMSSKMYSSSFLSQEGSRNIQSLLSNPGPQNQPPPQTSQYGYSQPPPHSQPAPYSYPPPQAYTPAATYPSQAQGYQPPYTAAPSALPYPAPSHPPSYPTNYEPPPVQSYQPPPINHPPPHPGGPPPQSYPPHYGDRFDNRPPYNPPGPMRGNPPGMPRGPRPYHQQAPPQQTKGLPTVRITGR